MNCGAAMPENNSTERLADANNTIDHSADVSKMVSPEDALNTIAANFMATMAARFVETCRKYGFSEEVAGTLLTGTLLEEPPNAGAFEAEWSDVYDVTIARTESEHNVKIESDGGWVEVVANDTGESVSCLWGADANDRSDQ